MDSIKVLREYFKEDKKNLQKLEDALSFIEEKTKDISCDLMGLFDLESFLLIKPDVSSVVSALISPVFESGLCSDEEVLKNFGKDVFEIVDALKKIHNLKFEENNEKSQIDALRKLFMIMAKNIRVVFVALAQRLYVMKNLSSIKSTRDKMMIAKETLHLYVPVAGRLGVYRMKTVLEDLSFRYVHEKEYNEILNELEFFGKSRARIIAILKRKIEDMAKELGFDIEVAGRIKSVYSIYKKFQKKNINTLSDLYDLFAVRLIVNGPNEYDQPEDVEKLYHLLGEIHNRWSPLPNRFKDYVSNPKANGYKSVHTIVLGLFEKDLMQPVEIQIRTRAMHNEAEYGVAAHWLYKSGGSPESEKVKAQADWIKGIEKANEKESKNELNFFKDRIFVLTPRGEIKDLPLGGTPIDFAYSVHSELGHRAYLAKVGEKVVSLNYSLSNGDVVYITTKAENVPKLEWLSFVKTPLARSMIKSYFNAQNVDFYLKEGKKKVNKQLEGLGKDLLDQNYTLIKALNGKELDLEERENILVEIGKGAQSAQDLMRKLFPENFAQKKKKRTSLGINKEVHKDLVSRILVGQEFNFPLKVSLCCSPKIGDEIVAYFKKGGGLTTIHKKDCKHLKNLNEERFMEASWR
jgi:GTP diphosphokinase / guanosine-3',5'-bis(diphosphate) 3'-diphosphatase